MNRQTILSRCDQESVVDKRNGVTTQNAIESKTARSRHEIEVVTYISAKGRTVRSQPEIAN